MKSGGTLADAFGLPLKSESVGYSVFQIAPLKPTEVFVSKIAPTTELGGVINRTSEVFQSIVPDRGEWGSPKLLGTIFN